MTARKPLPELLKKPVKPLPAICPMCATTDMDVQDGTGKSYLLPCRIEDGGNGADALLCLVCRTLVFQTSTGKRSMFVQVDS